MCYVTTMTNLFVLRELDVSATDSLPLPLARFGSRSGFWDEAWEMVFARVRRLRELELAR